MNSTLFSNSLNSLFIYSLALREECPYSEFFWSVFSRIGTEYGEMPSVQRNTDQKNSEHGHFSESVAVTVK